MREIKFRAWHPKTKIMTPWEELRKLYTNTWLPGGEFSVVMQYTQLKDKNGKEIYEGDIIKTRTDTTVVINSIFHGVNFYEKEAEVIGNVWENPELVEAKQSEEQ